MCEIQKSWTNARLLQRNWIGSIALYLCAIQSSYAQEWMWQNPSPPSIQFEDIQFVNDSVGWIVGGSANSLMHTTDGGHHWEFVDLPNEGEQPVELHGLGFFDENVGWVGAKGRSSIPPMGERRG